MNDKTAICFIADIAGGDFNQTFPDLNMAPYPAHEGLWQTGKLDAAIAFVLFFCQKFGAVIQTIPGPVLGGVLQFIVGKDFVFSLGGVALSTVVGIVLNLMIPKTVE